MLKLHKAPNYWIFVEWNGSFELAGMWWKLWVDCKGKKGVRMVFGECVHGKQLANKNVLFMTCSYSIKYYVIVGGSFLYGQIISKT